MRTPDALSPGSCLPSGCSGIQLPGPKERSRGRDGSGYSPTWSEGWLVLSLHWHRTSTALGLGCKDDVLQLWLLGLNPAVVIDNGTGKRKQAFSSVVA